MYAATVAILALSSFVWLMLLAGKIVDSRKAETDRFARYIRLHYPKDDEE